MIPGIVTRRWVGWIGIGLVEDGHQIGLAEDLAVDFGGATERGLVLEKTVMHSFKARRIMRPGSMVDEVF